MPDAYGLPAYRYDPHGTEEDDNAAFEAWEEHDSFAQKLGSMHDAGASFEAWPPERLWIDCERCADYRVPLTTGARVCYWCDTKQWQRRRETYRQRLARWWTTLSEPVAYEFRCLRGRARKILGNEPEPEIARLNSVLISRRIC
jgi:hypothetical protein